MFAAPVLPRRRHPGSAPEAARQRPAAACPTLPAQAAWRGPTRAAPPVCAPRAAQSAPAPASLACSRLLGLLPAPRRSRRLRGRGRESGVEEWGARGPVPTFAAQRALCMHGFCSLDLPFPLRAHPCVLPGEACASLFSFFQGQEDDNNRDNETVITIMTNIY